MRDGELSDEEKARSVLCRVGQPGNRVVGFDDGEIRELAGVYDACAGGDEPLGRLVAEFWGRRQARLDELKATASDEPSNLFRNRKPQQQV